jgi:hypothetical protein
MKPGSTSSPRDARDMNHDFVLKLHRNTEKALQEAADGVAEEARRTGGEVVVWEDGAIRYITADQLPPPKKPSP